MTDDLKTSNVIIECHYIYYEFIMENIVIRIQNQYYSININRIVID